MRFYRKKQNGGFTLVEVIVAVGIVTVLAAVVLVSIQEVRKKSRDAQRISDIANIQIALRLYKDANDRYPDIPGGEIIGDGAGALDTLLAPYLPGIPRDPNTAGGATYTYYYDSRHKCPLLDNGAPRFAVLYAQTMENASKANWGVHPATPGVCGSKNGDPDVQGTPTAATYGVVLGAGV